MKFSLTLLTLVFSSLLNASTEVVISPVDHLFIPNGFDNNDNVEVVVTGKYPSACFVRNKVDVEVKDNTILVNVTALLRVDHDLGLCMPMPVPFMEEITIGNLQAGEYKVVVNPGTPIEKKEKLVVAETNSQSVDDHFYAIVDYVDLGFTGGWGGSAILMARSPSSCLVFDRVEFLSNSTDTLSVLPIMKKMPAPCVEQNFAFTIPFNFPVEQFQEDRLLLYVRSLEGKSVSGLMVR